MKTLKTTAFAAVNVMTKPPYIMPWAVAKQANQVRRAVADNWGLSPGEVDGWKAAMRAGVRVVKVTIETVK